MKRCACGSVLSAVTFTCVRGAKCPQGELAGTARNYGGLARLKAAAPLRARKAQAPCDVGLFGDGAAQSDLVDMAKGLGGR